ncbi:hypothetical protein [Nocardioides daphniae]|uniref:Uncharacterized protein n=1 Tax=Nocardioides daphniae TaxID=402297 RepID=A0A4P7UBN2_9ACTN|nr:hypothetical protein [Nocardioides daphniae]QCC77582.1 hypothetical protein E2C04_11100 [Nocardioides daphniae]GGD30548.1 hypothetical protein GCM10007231_32490 [Nocardioides daphniae]
MELLTEDGAWHIGPRYSGIALAAYETIHVLRDSLLSLVALWASYREHPITSACHALLSETLLDAEHSFFQAALALGEVELDPGAFAFRNL